MPSPSFVGWWVVLADGQPMAIIKEINLARAFEQSCRAARVGKVTSVRAETRKDILRLQRGEAVLDALDRDGIEVRCLNDLGREALEKESEET
jgi:hypothetical protein